MTGQLWWYAARSGGFVAWGLLSGSVIWGLMLSGKVRPGHVRPSWLLDLHRFLGGLAAVFTGVHVLTIMADSYTSFGPADVLVPFVSSWNPGAVAWGIVGMYLLAAVEITSLLKKRLTHRVWKRVHALSLPLFVTATVHLLTAGTDASNPIATGVVATVSLVIAGLTVWRLMGLRRPSGRQATPRSAMIQG
jgi:DMSO/TMAO reductase YedYZ heme-binding membrane subunit